MISRCYTSALVLRTDINLQIKFLNGTAESFYGYTAAECSGCHLSVLASHHELSGFYFGSIVSSLLQHGYWSGNLLQKTKKGKFVSTFFTVCVREMRTTEEQEEGSKTKQFCASSNFTNREVVWIGIDTTDVQVEQSGCNKMKVGAVACFEATFHELLKDFSEHFEGCSQESLKFQLRQLDNLGQMLVTLCQEYS